MSESIIVALIMAASSLLCQVLINRSNRVKNARDDHLKETARAVQEREKEVRLEDRLQRIEEKLDAQDGYVEKLGEIQTDIAVIKTDIANLKGAA